MPSLKQTPDGAFKARKRIPDDVREDFGRLHGQRYEVKLFIEPGTKKHVAQQRYGEWLAEFNGRVEAIRAQRNGTGQTLTRPQARKLAADWYDWFTLRVAHVDRTELERRRDAVHDAFRSAGVSEEDFERTNPDDLFREHANVRDVVRPAIADVGETAQFLAAKHIALTTTSRDLFLDFLYDDLAAGLQHLLRRLSGDFSPDTYRKRFPKAVEATDSGITPWELFEKWIGERSPTASTIESWRYVFRGLGEHFKDRSAASIMQEEADDWIKSLVTRERSARTVANTWLKGAKTVFAWAMDNKHIAGNPFSSVKLTVPRKRKLRETQAFLPEERRTILRAAAAITDITKPDEAAKRWVPWLCAYTGSRPGEITQLRATDVIEREGIHALKITPDAGAVKGGEARVVPLHEHIIAQGFLRFLKEHGKGPLFYKPRKRNTSDDPTKQPKAPYAQARQRVAAWVRELGVDDVELSPNHAWRHTFKQIGRRAGIAESVIDNICGHAPASEGAAYGRASLEDMAEALKRFPRYTLKGS